jgi:hypothetical protein
MSDVTPLSVSQYLDLLLGPQNSFSAFADDHARRQAWLQSKAVLEALVDPGVRPSAWWDYEAPEPAGPRESVPEFLSRMGLLTLAEVRATREPHEIRNRRTEKREEYLSARRTG